MSNKYDVIIIGAGIAGLICGTKLAKNGLKVLILEKQYKPGGCVTSCKKNGFNFDYGAHLFGSCNKNGILRYYLDRLSIDVDFIRLNPTERFIFPDQTIEVPQNIDEYADMLKDRYPKEIRGIDPFFEEIVRIARSFSSNSLLNKYKRLTFEALLRRYFKNEKLMSVLSAEFRYLGVTPKHLAATSMCLMMVSYLRDGTYYPKGGTQNFPNAILKKFREYGGAFISKKNVTEIIVENYKAIGVKAETGETYKATVVISGSDAIKTFNNMIGAGCIKNKLFLKKLNKMKLSSSFFMGYLGVKTNLDLSRKSGWYHFAYGLDIKRDKSLYIFVPSLFDSSLAPEEKHVIELAMPFPYQFNRVKDWNVCKSKLRSRLLHEAERIIPGLSKAILLEQFATPKTIESYTSNSHGAMYGWDMDVDHVHDKRLPYNTPIDSLFLTGHWTNPGCGIVSAATSGWIVADIAIEKLSKGNKQATIRQVGGVYV